MAYTSIFQCCEGLSNPHAAKSTYLNFQPLEIVSRYRYRDPQLQVAENYSYLFNLSTNIYNLGVLTHTSFSITGPLIKQTKNDSSRDQQEKG